MENAIVPVHCKVRYRMYHVKKLPEKKSLLPYFIEDHEYHHVMHSQIPSLSLKAEFLKDTLFYLSKHISAKQVDFHPNIDLIRRRKKEAATSFFVDDCWADRTLPTGIIRIKFLYA